MHKSAMGKSVDAVKSLTDRDVEGSDQQSLAPKAVSSPFWGHMGRSASVAGRFSRTLSRTFSLVDLDDAVVGELAANSGHWRAGSRLSRRRYAVAASVLVFAALTFSLLSRPSEQAATQQGSVPGAQYLRGIAAWYDGQPKPPGGPPYDTYFSSCANQVRLPEIQLPRQLPMAHTWQPDAVYPRDPLDELALNCSTLRDSKACSAALDGSNLYEGDLPPLDSDDLARHSLGPQDSQVLGAAVMSDPLQDLDSLDLDCSKDPAACTSAAEHSNSYAEEDATQADGFDAAAEAEAYLYMAQTSSGWDTIIGHASQQDEDVQQPAADSLYESSEHLWVQMRIAEEAAPQYMDAALLDLDCSGGEGDAVIADECERSREVNRYETAAQRSCHHDSHIQVQHAEHGMPGGGYDMPCAEAEHTAKQLDTNGRGTQAAQRRGCGCGAHGGDTPPLQAHESFVGEPAAEPAMPAERLLALQLQLQQIAKLHRVTGYDVQALDDEQELAWQRAKQQPPAEVIAAVVVSHSDELLQARMYYKNPCNDPAAHQYFKNRRHHPMHRMYYKNPANAPAIIQEAEGSTRQQAPIGCSNMVCKAASTTAALLPNLLGVLATLLAAAAGSWYFKAHGYQSKAQSARVHVKNSHAPAQCFSKLAECPIYEEAEEEADELAHHHGSSSSQRLPSNPSGNNLLVPVSRLSSMLMATSTLPNPSLYTCASTIHESLFESDVDAGAAAAATAAATGVFSSMATARTSQMDDVPEPGVDSPRATQTSIPTVVDKKLAD